MDAGVRCSWLVRCRLAEVEHETGLAELGAVPVADARFALLAPAARPVEAGGGVALLGVEPGLLATRLAERVGRMGEQRPAGTAPPTARVGEEPGHLAGGRVPGDEREDPVVVEGDEVGGLGGAAEPVLDPLGAEVAPGLGPGPEDDCAERLGVSGLGRADLPGVGRSGQLNPISLATRWPEATALFM